MKSTLWIALVSIALGASIASASRPAHFSVQEKGKAYIQDEPRGMARVLYFGDAGIAGEYSIEYGKPAWKDEYDKMLKGRLRLGNNYWTTLDTWNDLSIGDKEVKAGMYFVALERSDKGVSLVLPDSSRRKSASAPAQTKAASSAGVGRRRTPPTLIASATPRIRSCRRSRSGSASTASRRR